MRKTLFQIALLCGTISSAQVGIGTENPLATLHIKENRDAVNNVNDATSTDGIMIPKISKVELALKQPSAYSSSTHEGLIVYVNNITGTITGPSASMVDQINSMGFYYISTDGKWLPVSKKGLDPSDDAWVDNPINKRVELGTSSIGNLRMSGSEVVISDAGNLGINNTNPSKRLHVNLQNGVNSSDAFRITNLKSENLIDRTLVIDNNGFVGIRSDESVAGKIQRFPITKIQSVNAAETMPILIDPDTNSASNSINTITPAFTPSTTKTGISLPAGVYKLEIKIVGYFNNADVKNSVEVKTLVNGLEYSSQNYGSNTTIGTNNQNYNGFTTMDFIELKSPAEIDFVIKNNVNTFTVVDYIQDSNQRIYGSLILIQRLK
ncbi:MAG: hypothetical protein KBS93_10800 [Flavobacteriaceae bacterium]|nr:hypothetical protein [Candidatus Onthonaster equi]